MPDRQRPGEVRDAIRVYLGQIKHDATVREIHLSANEQLGSQVPASSIRSSLRLSSLFEQTTRGRYRLAKR